MGFRKFFHILVTVFLLIPLIIFALIQKIVEWLHFKVTGSLVRVVRKVDKKVTKWLDSKGLF